MTPENLPRKAKRAPQARAAQTRQKILLVARNAISQNGFEATTTLDISQRAEVAEGSVFAHFKSKQGLLMALMQDHYATLTRDAQTIAQAHPDPVDRLQRLVAFHLARLLDAWPLLRVFVHYGRYGDPEMVRMFHQLNRAFTQIFQDCLGDLSAKGHLAVGLSPLLLRDMIFGTAEHWAYRAMELSRPLDTDEAAHFIVSRVLAPDTGASCF